MPNNPDIYIKDEGDFSSVFFVTERSKEAIMQQVEFIAKAVINALQHGHPIGDEPANIRLDIDNDQVHRILEWAVSHNLVIESEVDIIIPSKQKA